MPPRLLAEDAGEHLAPLPRATLEARKENGPLARLQVEIAASPQARARGLMFRRQLGRDEGMLLLWRTPRRVAIWMKNTYLPLDIIFIDARGRIVRIIENAKPLTTQIMPSGLPVLAVLEVPAGTVARLGLEKGMRITLPRSMQAP